MHTYLFLLLLLFAPSVDVASAADLAAKANFNCNLGKTGEANFYADSVQRILSASADESVVHTLVMGQ